MAPHSIPTDVKFFNVPWRLDENAQLFVIRLVQVYVD